MNYEDIWENKPDDFKPSDFFDEGGKSHKHTKKNKKGGPSKAKQQ